MPNQKNIDQVAYLKDQLANAKAVVLLDYAGLTVKDQTKLRKKMKETGGRFLVTKNTLFSLAFKQNHEGIIDEVSPALSGTTAFLFAVDDEIAPLKALIEFTREKDLPKLKIGVMLKPSDRVMSSEEMKAISQLPSKNELIAKLIGTLNAPTYRLVSVLSGNLRKLVVVLGGVKKLKEAN